MKQMKYIWEVLKKAVAGFGNDNCFLYSAALSFYTLFSIAPVLLITIYTAGIFVDDQTVRQEIIAQFQRLIGGSGAQGVETLMNTLSREDQNIWSVIIGVVILIITATNIFMQIQNSFDIIFRVKPIKNKNLVKQLLDRAISLGMIISLGFVMIISLIADSLIVFLTKYFMSGYEEFSTTLIAIGQNIIMLGIVFLVVYALLRFLADVKIRPKLLRRGSLLITVLLMAGKFGIGWYIANSNFSELGGASASVIILMLWVYYSSFILFFGAEIIKAQSIVKGMPFEVKKYATRIKYVEVKADE